MTNKELKEAVLSGEIVLAEHPAYRQQFEDYLSSLAALVKHSPQDEVEKYSQEMDHCIALYLKSADLSFSAAEPFYLKARRSSLALADTQPTINPDTSDEYEDDNDDFQTCDNCDLPDACSDFGCAIKTGVRKSLMI